MKAFVFTDFGGPETQTLVDLPKPAPGRGQLLVAVRAAGVNPVDWKSRAGWLRDFVEFNLPAVMGSEVAGIVEEVGEGVEGFAVGDEVFGYPATGAFAEYTLVPAATAALVPEGLSFEEAATLPVAVGAAYDGIQQLGVKEGMTLLVVGAGGGVGVAALQIGGSRGARVIGVASPEKRELVESLGAVHVASGEGAAQRVTAIAPEGVDAILDLVGGPACEALVGVLSSGGQLVSAADFTVGRLGGELVDRHLDGDAFSAIAAFVQDISLDPCILATYPLDRTADALALVESGHNKGKVVVRVA